MSISTGSMIVVSEGASIFTLSFIGQGKGKRHAPKTEEINESLAKRYRVVEVSHVDESMESVYWKGNCGFVNVTDLKNVRLATESEAVKKVGRPRKTEVTSVQPTTGAAE